MNKTGFGFLRLPQIGDKIDDCRLFEMVDLFLAQGGSYFDTAYTYLGGTSEEALRRSLVERHPRETFRIADKLPGWKVKSHEQCQDYFDTQLSRCGVDYFDVYLIHWLNRENYAICEKTDQFRFLRELKAAGKVDAIGFSYHDSPELLEEILTAHPETEYVQLQINYLDWESEAIQARKCYETAVRHGKRVIVMEPVKGGTLADIPDAARELLQTARPNDSVASWAIRFAASLEAVEIVLSGMSTREQVLDNGRQYEALSREELELLAKTAEILRENTAIACTGCGYCAPNCPKEIPIPKYFAIYNEYARKPSEDWKMKFSYDMLAEKTAKASACVGCRTCESSCPQKLEITRYLREVSKAFE